MRDGAASVRCFGEFQFDPQSAELSRAGARVALQYQPAKALALLTDRAGQLITRQELKQAIWGDATFVDFDRNLNYCIREIRRALGDSARQARFVETLPRRGYRFLASVQRHGDGARVGRVARLLPRAKPGRQWVSLVAAGLLGAISAAFLEHRFGQSAFHHATVRVLHASFGIPAGRCPFGP
jgi:DNA-binding winged helix-turn-helix (wHTH) protein